MQWLSEDLVVVLGGQMEVDDAVVSSFEISDLRNYSSFCENLEGLPLGQGTVMEDRSSAPPSMSGWGPCASRSRASYNPY